MKRILQLSLLLLAAVFTTEVDAQTYQVATTGRTSANSFPLSYASINRLQSLYLRSEFSTAPIPGFVTKVYFKSNTSAPSGTTFTDFVVKLGNTSITTLTAGPWVTPVTTVINAASYTFSGPIVAGDWIPIPLPSPFFYDGSSNLIFEMSQNGYTTGLTMSNFPGPNSGNYRLYGALSATTGSVGVDHVEFAMDVIPSSPNNAAAGPFTEPNNFCGGTFPVKLLVKSNGANGVDSMKIDWSINGVLQPQINFTTPLLSALNAPLNQAIVTLGNVTFAAAPITIKAWTSLPNGVNDTYHGDDTVTKTFQSSLNGTYTIGGTSPDYASLDLAASDLSTYGICGPVIFNVRNGTYTNQRADIGTVAGVSAVNTITFKSETNNAANVIFNTNSTSTSNNFIFKLGCDYIRIKHLTLNPTNTSYGRAIEYAGSNRDSISNCNINLTASTSSSNFRTAIYGNGQNSYNVVNDINIANAAYGVYDYGAYANYNDSNFYLNIKMTDVYYSGFYSFYSRNLRIENCEISRGSGSIFYGVYAYYAYDNMSIKNNKITVTGATSTLYGIQIYYAGGGQTSPAVCRNNVLNLNGSSTIYGLSGRYSNNLYILNNTVVVNSSSSSCYAGYMYNQSSSYTGSVCNNNIFWNKSNSGVTYYNYNPSFFESDYNNIYGGSTLLQSGSPNQNTNNLASFSNATNGSETNSISYSPGLDPITLIPIPGNDSSWSIQGRGNQYYFNDKDAAGNSRPTFLAAGVPDLGAYEFTNTVLPPFAIATPATAVPGAKQAFTFGQDTIAVLEWDATSAIPTSSLARYYSGVIPPGLPAGSYMYYYTDVIVAGTGLLYKANSYYQDPQKGTSPNSESTIRMGIRNGSNPWISFPGTQSSIDPIANILKVDSMTKSNLYTGRVDNCLGQPLPFAITNPPLNGTLCGGQQAFLTGTDPNTSANIIYRWQSAPTATGPWTTILGANTLNFVSAPLFDTTYYRIVDTCTPSGLGASSAVYRVPVSNPQLSNPQNGIRCGPGVVTLSATPSTNATLNWFTSATALNAIAVGSTFNTPVLNVGQYSYYVEANIGACKSARVLVKATVNPGPTLTTTDTLGLCSNEIGMLTVAPNTLNNFDSFTWTPINNLYVNAAATIPYTANSNSTTVYYKSTPTIYEQVFLRGFNLTTDCSNIDTANIWVAPPVTTITATRDTICVMDTTTLILSPIANYLPGGVVWQSSGTPFNFNTLPSDGTAKFLTGTISSDTFYRARIFNSAGAVCNMDTINIIKADPKLLTTTDSVRCGPGSVQLQATANAGSSILWYAGAAGGLPIFTGPIFNTAILPVTTTFYASAQVGSVNNYTVGETNNQFSTTNGHTTGQYQMKFTVNGNINLSSVDIFTTAAANIAGSIRVVREAGNVQVASIPFTTNGAGANAAQTINLNVPLAPGNYYLVQGTSLALSYNYSYTGYPKNSPYLNITNCSTPSFWANFYNWKYTQNGCESNRTPVTATVTPSQFFSVTDTQSVCNREIATINVLAGTPYYSQVTWKPTTTLYTDPGATIGYVPNSSSNTVYARANAAGYIGYQAIGLDPLSGCQGIDTAVVLNLPLIRGIDVNPDSLCFNGSSELTVLPTGPYLKNNTLQWYDSVKGNAYRLITGAKDTTYNTPVLTDTTWYRIRTTNTAGAVCQEFTRPVIVKIPTLTGVFPATRCGVGTVDLRATGLPGYDLKWYTSLTAQNAIYTGDTFSTPLLRNTTTYYVAAGNSGSASVGMLVPIYGYSTTGRPWGLQFDATTSFTIKEVTVYPVGTGAGTVTVQLQSSTGTVLQTGTYNITGFVNTAVFATPLPLNFNVPPGTDYRLMLTAFTGGISSLSYEYNTAVYPYTVPGVMSIKAGLIAANAYNYYYNYFYDWQLGTGCTSPRQAVTATVNPAPLVSIVPTDTMDICFGDVATFNAVSADPDYKYTWLPVQVPGATLSVQPNTSASYILTAVDTGSTFTKGCAWYDTVYARVNPTPAADAVPMGALNLCVGDSLLLVTPADTNYVYQWIKNNNNLIGATASSYTATSQGAYSVRVTLANCTITSQPKNVTVNPLPQPTIAPNGAILSTGRYVSYQWLKSGQIIYGATGQSYLPTENGDYEVVVTDANGCTNRSSIFRLSSLGVTLTNAIGGDISIFPNPVATTLNITSPIAVKAVITTADGRVVLKQDNVKQMNVSSLADGVYFIRVYGMEDGSILKTEKMLKATK